MVQNIALGKNNKITENIGNKKKESIALTIKNNKHKDEW